MVLKEVISIVHDVIQLMFKEVDFFFEMLFKICFFRFHSMLFGFCANKIFFLFEPAENEIRMLLSPLKLRAKRFP